MHLVLLEIGKTVGKILMTYLLALLSGRTFRALILFPFQKLAQRSPSNKLEQTLVHDAEKDLDVAPLPPEPNKDK